MINGWRHDDVSKSHGAALMRHIRYAGFFKLTTIVWNSIFARTQQVHIVLCSQLINRWAAQICVVLPTRYNFVWRFFTGLPLKMTSQRRHNSVCESFWWRYSTKHTKQHNISKTLADCYINCTVYNDLQLFYKEKVKKISFIPKGLPIVNR